MRMKIKLAEEKHNLELRNKELEYQRRYDKMVTRYNLKEKELRKKLKSLQETTDDRASLSRS